MKGEILNFLAQKLVLSNFHANIIINVKLFEYLRHSRLIWWNLLKVNTSGPIKTCRL